MPFAIVLAPQAVEDLGRLKASVRSSVKSAMETHLRHGPEKTSRSRIKRLRGQSRPQYRLRVGDIRVFYDVADGVVESLGSSAEIGDDIMARPVRKIVKEVPLAVVKDDFSRYLREAAAREILITRHGKPAGILIGFESEDDWLEYRFENDPRFLKRIAKARASLRAGRGVPLEDVE
jgi:prevent-host-death family protein